uniref:D-tagatose 3-epimerase n=1 Tax=uncultured Planctomycetota bacterium TaxID=120965 RepID=A0A5B8JP97_9BACT|nr:D-tagatose 3-epimerase [uncultured Planctomycetota bacterium]
MYAAVNAWTFPDNMSTPEQLAAAADAGFEGLELVVSADGPLQPDTPIQQFVQLANRGDDLNLQLVGLASALFWEFNYASPNAGDRQRAQDLTLQMLDRAAAARAGAVLLVPAVVGKAGDAAPTVAYADALYRTVEALSELRFEAEARAVVLAIENVWNRFLLSPVEAAELIDRINSPYVGFYLDTGNVLACGYPQDWIATLGGRIARVHAKDYDLSKPGAGGFCPLGEGSVDWPAVVAALGAVGYEGPLTYEGDGNPKEVCRRLKNILADRPAIAGEVQR